MANSIHLGAISLDSADPQRAASFYRELLDLTVIWETDDFVALKGAGVLITVQRDPQHQAPTWPEAEVPKQMHLEFAVDHLDWAEQRAIDLGASKPETQPRPESWRVLLDPDGHPFCVTTLIPEI